MPTKKEMVVLLQRDALYAYLEFCNTAYEIPRKDTYEPLMNCEDAEMLDRLTCVIESGHSEIEKHKENWDAVKELKESVWHKIINYFK